MAGVPLQELVAYADALLRVAVIPDYPGAFNGLQAENSGRVTRIAAAVDANAFTLGAAVRAGADLLLVHHGLFWGETRPLTGVWRAKVAKLIEGDLAVYSAHLPLDAHPELGNNALLCKALGFRKRTPFFEHEGVMLGFRAAVDLARRELVRRLETAVAGPVWVCPAGPERVRQVGVVSGGAGGDVARAAADGVDTFISGEAPHHAFGLAEELGVNLLLGGHYGTETFGVKALAEHLSTRFAVPWEFIAHPSGL